MATQTKTRRATAKTGIDARDLLLAGIGAVSLTRKQSIKLYDTLLDEGKQFQGIVGKAIEDLQGQAKLGADLVLERVDAIVTPVRERLDSTYGAVKSELETRLAPVLSKLGVKPAVKPRARAAAKRPVAKAKRAVRKAKKAA